MKRAAILLTLVAVMAFAPSAFAGCAKCNTSVGCFGATQGWVDCFFDGECHRIGGFCQDFTGEETQLAATYTVAAVHVVKTETAPVKAPKLDTKTLSAPQEAEKAAVGR
jgi:hypothetical protein